MSEIIRIFAAENKKKNEYDMKYNYYPTVQVKKSFLTTIFILMCGLSAHAAEYYGFKIGGVPVTSSNCNDVTGNNITSGTVKYDKSTNTVTLTNVTINRTSSDGRCIFTQLPHPPTCPRWRLQAATHQPTTSADSA